MPPWVKEVTPLGPHVYVKVQDAEEKTAGGILLPGAAQQRPTSGRVVAVGDGKLGGGKTKEFHVKGGDEVLFSKFGFAFTELKMGEDEYLLMKESDIIGIMPRPDAVADDVPELRPLGDRVLVKVAAQNDVTVGGLMLPESAREKPLSGEVVRVGPGPLEDDGSTGEMSVAPGDTVVYFKYAGDQMETTDGTQYVVLHESDILCKL